MFRPAKLGRDPTYGPSDPNNREIPGVTQTYLGPLAKDLNFDGGYAFDHTRANLYRGLHPYGGEKLLTGPVPENYRPVIGGNFHASKTIDLWLAGLTKPDRRRAEAVYARCCKEVLEKRIFPDMVSRTGAAGSGGRVAAKAMAVMFLHGTNSAKQYHLHVLLEIHNLGKAADGTVRTLDSEVLFTNQGRYSLEVEARVMLAFHREFGVVLRPGPNRSLEVKGLESARDIPTLRQELIYDWLDRRGQPRTLENIDRAARETHLRRDPGLTVDAAAAATRSWYAERGVDGRGVVVDLKPRSPLVAAKTAEAAVSKAVVTAERLGARFSLRSLHTQALRHGLDVGADPDRVERLVRGIGAGGPGRERFAVRSLGKGLFTTERIELLRSALFHTVRRLTAAGRGVSAGDADPPAAVRALLDGFRATGRQVHLVAGPATRDSLGAALGGRAVSHESFAARLAEGPQREALPDKVGDRAARERHDGSTGGDRYEAALGASDVVVLDVRRAGTRAAAHIAAAAERAGASVVVIGRVDPPAVTPVRERGRDDD